ncbi:DUF1573 domain-containing protein [Paludisphaera borealis]|uniref:DUF1573 domain-containing protein n=1 Tax=Paludisphaera borealis TaxID=1387353 RepID=A0A1U7CL41_9BACT|nr:DUF1573 domain-containing protein [Paludisphaera borealis]APW59652.1 hypothetical protein BSF38_01081 [Paludisphaera borealis]
MRWMMLNGCCLIILAGSGAGAVGQEFDWLASALPERAHDFGTVARGSQLRYSFPLVNRSDQEIRINNWRAKCGCTNVNVGAKVIPPGTQTTIEVTVDTTKFSGPKPSGLTLIFERPTFVEVDLNTSCYIRSDIVTNPGLVDFGIFRRTDKMPSATLTVTYAGGRPDWDVVKMKTRSANVVAKGEPVRTVDGQVNFTLTATLDPSVPNGYFKDEITLITNDETTPAIPIAVVANIQSAVALTPSIVNFGQVRPGESVSKTVLVRSSEAFSITNLSTSQDELKSADQTTGAKPVHQVKLTLKAPTQAGPFHSTLTVKTDIPDEPAAILKTFATVGP